jgi:hypothetical protein
MNLQHQNIQAGILLIRIIKDKSLNIIQEDNNILVRELLKNLTAEEFFKYYSERPSYENLAILTGDGIVIPEIGLTKALSKKEYVNQCTNYSRIK